MRPLLGAASAFAVAVVLAGCGDERLPSADEAPTQTVAPSPTSTPTESTAPPEPQRHVIPDDFPLLDGYPTDDQAEGDDYGRKGPSRELDPIEPEACGERVALPPHLDRLRGGWANVEDFRERQLVVFTGTKAAQAYAEQLLGLYVACPEDHPDEHSRVLTVVERGGLGDWSGVAVSRDEYDGLPTTGMVTTQVVRVGRAVLIATEYGEAGAWHDAVAWGAVRSQDAIVGLVAAMDQLRAAGAAPTEAQFGPEGFGLVVLGLPREELLTWPGVRITGGNDQCDSFETPRVSGGLQPGLGVAYVSLPADLETPEGIHHGSTYAEVLAAYPDAEGDQDILAAEPPGYEDRYYRIELARDRVSGIVLMHREQQCAS